jgi:hypothetical protein
MADADEDAPSALAPLPHAVLLSIFAQLPVDLRARCACVCRGWRAALSERSLWTRLDVSRASSVTVAVTDALLRGAAARAGGALEALDVSRSRGVSREARLAVVTANAGTLRELRMCNDVCDFDDDDDTLLSLGETEALLRAAPQLRVLDAHVACDSVVDARRALRAEGLLAPLRVHGLRVAEDGAAEADMLALSTDVAAHAVLQALCFITDLPTPAALDAIVAAALVRQLTALELGVVTAPVLARLLGGSHIQRLVMWGGGRDAAALLDERAATLLAGALRANNTLTVLQLAAVQFWDNAAAASTLMGALTAHPSLRTLSLRFNEMQDADRAAAGATLGALLAANAPALIELDVSFCLLRDAGMAPLFEALPANTHLRTLRCSGNGITEAFVAAVLLPAVRANACLRILETAGGGGNWPGEREAEEIVNRRADAR